VSLLAISSSRFFVTHVDNPARIPEHQNGVRTLVGSPVVPRPDGQRSENARALLAICELMQCKLLSPATIAYLGEVRDMLQRLIEAESSEDKETATSA
jgi:hypothetical protein